MGLRLNKLSDAEVLEELAYKTKGLKKTADSKPPDGADAKKVEKYYRFLARKSQDVGACLYQQQRDPVVIRQHFQTAGEALVRMHEVRGEPAPNASRNPWTYVKALNLMVCFCGLELRDSVSGIPESAYRNPPRAENQAISAYINLLVPYVNAGGFDQSQFVAAEELASGDTESKAVRNWILPAIRGLQAIVDGDESGLMGTIESLIETHEGEALKGEYRRSPDGFICLPGLMLAKLGLERRLPCDIESDYLPLNLLESVR